MVVPADLRERIGLAAGQPLLLLEAPGGLLLLTREQAKAMIRDNLRGLDLVGDLLAERQREAAADNAA